MAEALCTEGSPCMVRTEVDTAKKDVDILFQKVAKTDEKVQAIEVSLAKIAGATEFLKWGIPAAIGLTGVVVTILVKVMG